LLIDAAPERSFRRADGKISLDEKIELRSRERDEWNSGWIKEEMRRSRAADLIPLGATRVRVSHGRMTQQRRPEPACALPSDRSTMPY
jgi:hypothetical protein